MKKDIDIYELIEAYLKGSLSDKERQMVEQRIKTDAEFARVLDQHRTIHTIINEGSLLDIRDRLNHIHHSAVAKKSRFPRKPGTYLAIVGILSLPVILLFLRDKSNTNGSTHRISIVQSADTIIPQDTIQLVAEQKEETPAAEIPEKVINEIQATTETSLPENGVKISNDTARSIVDRVEEKRPEELITDRSIDSVVEEKPEPEPVITPEVSTEEEDTVDCSKVTMEAEVVLEKSCFGKPTGRITVVSESIGGGTPPYKMSIDNGENYYDQTDFRKLLPRVYTLWIKDKDNCLTCLGTYSIESMDCSMEYVFAPLKDEFWEVPSRECAGNLKIYNQQGRIVWEKQLAPGEKYQWDGTDINGNLLKMGMYPFLVIFENGEQLTGGVTIVK
jgi:hypothetical protein